MKRLSSPLVLLVILTVAAIAAFGVAGLLFPLALVGLHLGTNPQARKVAGYRLACLAYDVRASIGAALLSFMCHAGLALRVFPGSVTTDLGFGIVGEWAFDGPQRAQPARINHATAADIVIGRWFTLNAAGEAVAGGAGAIGGVLMNPKNMASPGTAANGPLAPTMTLPTGTIAEFGYFGAVVVSVTGAVAIGAAAKYNTTTGVIGAGAPGGGEAAIPNSKFIRYANAATGLVVLELTN